MMTAKERKAQEAAERRAARAQASAEVRAAKEAANTAARLAIATCTGRKTSVGKAPKPAKVEAPKPAPFKESGDGWSLVVCPDASATVDLDAGELYSIAMPFGVVDSEGLPVALPVAAGVSALDVWRGAPPPRRYGRDRRQHGTGGPPDDRAPCDGRRRHRPPVGLLQLGHR